VAHVPSGKIFRFLHPSVPLQQLPVSLDAFSGRLNSDHRKLLRKSGTIFTVNLKSVFLVTQAVIGGMRKRKWGRIINLSSVAAQTGGAVGAHYAASKAGIIGLTHSCASAFVREGITVNAIAPALIETNMVTSNPNASPDLIPMGHFGSVDDVASVAVMLAMNEYMTGQNLSVNGGWYMS
jgi:3-oxoacyl-[acyl-carrier protein] reductase